MKISVVNEHWDIDAALATHSPKKITANAILELVDNADEATAFDVNRLFRQFMVALESCHKVGEFEDKPVTIELNLTPMSEEVAEGNAVPAGNLWSITIKSEALKEIQQAMHYGNPVPDLQLELTLTCTMIHDTENKVFTAESVVLNCFEAQKDAKGVISHDCYQRDSVEVKVPGSLEGYYRTWSISLKVDGRDFVYVADMLPKCSEADRKIFTNKKWCDFKIVSGNGAVYRCHKIFLWAKSPVFGAMLDDKKFKEGVESKLVIDDMSARGVYALLEFLYCDDVSQALAYCDVALELLKASDKYDISLLWKVVAKILAKKPHTWYTVDDALKLGSFLVSCPRREESDVLEEKVVQVLTWKSKKLANSTVYQELFPTDLSKGMFKLLLEAGERLRE